MAVLSLIAWMMMREVDERNFKNKFHKFFSSKIYALNNPIIFDFGEFS